MDNVNHGIEKLIAMGQEYAPRTVAAGIAHFQDLGLFVALRQVQVMQRGAACLFVSEVTASAQARQHGITITCVGLGGDMPSAVANAVGQWSIGVLPVLAHWRGKHSCLADSTPIETQGGPFDLLVGPVVAKGPSEGETPPATASVSPAESLLDVLRMHRAAQRLHWLEMYACKIQDGSVEATCRLDNRDWMPGQRILLSVAASWPAVNLPLQSSRQFALLLPRNGDTQKIVVPSFFARLFGRA